MLAHLVFAALSRREHAEALPLDAEARLDIEGPVCARIVGTSMLRGNAESVQGMRVLGCKWFSGVTPLK